MRSDGLSGEVPTDDVARILHEHEDGRAAFELWKAAIDAGAPDNITLARGPPRRPGPKATRGAAAPGLPACADGTR